jgi:RNA polymerase subunit RPABC4/transcription elongation factor Spt4
MRLFKRTKPQGSLCPRCSQIVTDPDALVCPMCGWDVRDAYQGPAIAQHAQAPATIAPSDGHDADRSVDRPV